MTLLGTIKSITCGILELSDAVVTEILFFGDNSFSASFNTLILTSMTDYVMSTKRRSKTANQFLI